MSKIKKWFKLRPTLNWLGTKGLTVGTTILNLITAIIKFLNSRNRVLYFYLNTNSFIT